ncbi:MAG: glycoside hydrolase family 3 protein [Treponema sp.]|jgi:beta-N-acetylhexosaminidase|nr:glycoside hydrolase family 3 protein [Treponema sp.]
MKIVIMRPLSVFSALLSLLVLLFSGCSGRNAAANNTSAEDSAAVNTEDQAAKDHAARLQAASRIAAALSDRQLAAQVIISGIDGKGRLPSYMRLLLTECPAGGIMLFRYNLDTDNDAIQELIAETAAFITSENIVELQTIAAVPPFITVDHEGGSVNRFRPGVADLPPAASYREIALNKGRDSAIAQVNADSFNAGKAINTLGINLNLAPVAEYLNAENRDFLEDRSYGPDPAFAAEAAGAFIAGMEQAGVLCVVKHFPGSAGADPHRFPSVLKGGRDDIAELTGPIAALIHDGHARAVMVSHSVVPAWDSANIASLSPVVMGEWLRQELGFEGIIVCDDFSMAAAAGPVAASGTAAANQSQLKPETAAVLSLAAGADMVLVWPPDLRRTHRAIVAALDDGSLSRERLREAAGRIIFEKIRMGLIHDE